MATSAWIDWRAVPSVRWHFITDLSPKPGDASYWARLYSLEVTPDHIRGVDGLVVLRPWVKRSTFAEGAADLVVIGRSGAGYDKIDLDACTEHGVAVFNAPMALNHSTASSALLFMLALAKRLHGSRADHAPGTLGSASGRDGERDPGAGRWASSAWATAAGSWRDWSRRLRCASWRFRPMPIRPRPPVARRSPDFARGGPARVGFHQLALSAHRRNARSDRCGSTGPDEAGRLLHQRRPGRAGRPAGPGGRPA